MSDNILTPEEKHVLAVLGDAYEAFRALSILHPSDAREFEHAIHQAQNIILARPAMRALYEGEKIVRLVDKMPHEVSEDAKS